MNGIKYMRLTKRIKQKDFADAIGVKQCTVSAWECGKSNPRLEYLLKMATLFNCSVDEILREH